MDYFIGEPELIGRGLGRAMLAAYLDGILFPSFPEERRCIVCYETANAASGGVLRSLGFRREKDRSRAASPAP
jgi:RimJ/RimL family protein N-acetyltransferase